MENNVINIDNKYCTKNQR